MKKKILYMLGWFTTGGIENYVLNVLDHIDKERYEIDFLLHKKGTYGAEKVLLLCDRGLLDNRAYMTEEEFASCLCARGETLEEYLARYDAVFHLTTAAIGAEAFYTTANNKARTETVEQAREVDARLLAAWKEHKRHTVIDNDGDFSDKMRRLCDAVSGLLSEAEK